MHLFQETKERCALEELWVLLGKGGAIINSDTSKISNLTYSSFKRIASVSCLSSKWTGMALSSQNLPGSSNSRSFTFKWANLMSLISFKCKPVGTAKRACRYCCCNRKADFLCAAVQRRDLQLDGIDQARWRSLLWITKGTSAQQSLLALPQLKSYFKNYLRKDMCPLAEKQESQQSSSSWQMHETKITELADKTLNRVLVPHLLSTCY